MGRQDEPMGDEDDKVEASAEFDFADEGALADSEKRAAVEASAKAAEERFQARMKAQQEGYNGSPPPPDHLTPRRAQTCNGLAEAIQAIKAGNMAAICTVTVDVEGGLQMAMHVEGDEGTLYILVAALEETKMSVLQHLQQVKQRRVHAEQQRVQQGPARAQ
jgi:hypothetical protein